MWAGELDGSGSRGQEGASINPGLVAAVGSCFKDFMTLADLYHYPTQHFDFHQRQLTLGRPAGC